MLWRHCFLLGIVTSSYQQCVNWQINHYLLKYVWMQFCLLLNCCYQSLFPSLSLSHNIWLNHESLRNVFVEFKYKCYILSRFLNTCRSLVFLLDPFDTHPWQIFDIKCVAVFVNVCYPHYCKSYVVFHHLYPTRLPWGGFTLISDNVMRFCSFVSPYFCIWDRSVVSWRLYLNFAEKMLRESQNFV